MSIVRTFSATASNAKNSFVPITGVVDLQVEDATEASAHLAQERRRGGIHAIGDVGLVQCDEGGHVHHGVPR
jgi:hypothetical protein